MTQRAVVVAGGLLLATVASVVAIQAQQPAPRTPATINSVSRDGRYQIVFGPFARADIYLVDTQLGRVWHAVTLTDVEGEPEVWRPQPRFDTDGDEAKWAVTQTFKKQR